MSNLAVMQLTACEGRCGAMLRDGRYCTACERLAVELERKRLSKLAREREIHAAPCEASDLFTILVGTTVRERVQIAAMCLGVCAVGGGLLFLLLLGARTATGWVIRHGL